MWNPLPVFRLEDYLGRFEFKAPFLLCCSDAEGWSLTELLALADRECLSAWNGLRLSYTEVPGLPLLRAEIAKLYPGLSPQQILCSAGAGDGIYCSLLAMLAPGDHALVVTPCYQSLEAVPRSVGAQVTTLELEEAREWKLDLDRLEQSLKPNTRLIVINFPHNPTGSVLEESGLNRLVEIARRRGIHILSDEVYRLIGPADLLWTPPVASLYEKGLSLGVMSKAYGLAGLRIGWVACRDESLLKKIEQVKHYTSICNGATSEILSVIALRAKEQILGRNNAIVRENISLLDSFLKRRSAAFSWVRPQGGCVGFVRYDGPEPVDVLAKELVEKAGVLLMPASVYGLSTNHFRIGFGRKNMPEALGLFESFVAKRQ